MQFESTTDDALATSEALSPDQLRELLIELQQATRGTSQLEIHELASVLCQILNLDLSGTDDDAVKFVAASLDEIRKVVASDASASVPLDSLRAEAIERWGDRLAFRDNCEFDASYNGEFERWESLEDKQSEADAEQEIVAPTAEEIRELMSKLGKTADDAAAPAFAAHQDAPPAFRDTDQSSVQSLDPELREAFLDDASSCIGSMENALLRLEADPQHSDSLNQICRELHTLKGASASVGLTDLADQLHRLEDNLREDQIAGRSPAFDSMLRSVDSIRIRISGNNGNAFTDVASPPSETQHNSQPNPIQPIPCPTSSSPAPPTTAALEESGDDESVRVKSSQLNRLMDMLAELVMLRNRRDTELSALQEVYHELIGSVSKMRHLSNEGSGQAIASSSLQLSEIANDVLEVAQNVRDCARPVAEGNAAVSQFIRQFRQELVELRRTPVSGLFRRLQRVVRDAAQAESKRVQLRLLGEDAGIERSVQQRLYEPLLHIVRNAVCHGIETAEERQHSGKNPVGTITLEAKAGPDLLVIEIRDDGRGLDYEAIRRRAIESDLLRVDQMASHDELAQLIFHPGFSTRQTVDQVAGRGVGMDVVASTLHRMRGWLEVDSQPQQGTRIRLSFPLPSVIQHAMVFRADDQLFAVPMQSVRNAGEVYHNAPCLRFVDLIGGQLNASNPPSQHITLACEAPGHFASKSASVTLMVDEIVGPEEVVVRPLPKLLKHHPFCAGATLSGMGQTVLLLDARRMVETQSHLLAGGSTSEQSQSPAQQNAARNYQPVRPKVLVVDDSLSARKRVVRSMQRYPVDILEAGDGKEALRILKTQQFAAVLSDMEMPHVSGMELLAAINADDRSDSPPVVIISSRSEDEFTSRARELGAHDYLIKPLANEALDAVIAGIASLQHLSTH